jgi:hypothetical protein
MKGDQERAEQKYAAFPGSNTLSRIFMDLLYVRVGSLVQFMEYYIYSC